MFFSVYEAIGWVYYKQEGEPQADGTEETAGLRKGCHTGVEECEAGVYVGIEPLWETI